MLFVFFLQFIFYHLSKEQLDYGCITSQKLANKNFCKFSGIFHYLNVTFNNRRDYIQSHSRIIFNTTAILTVLFCSINYGLRRNTGTKHYTKVSQWAMTLQLSTETWVTLTKISLHYQSYYWIFMIFLSHWNNFTMWILRMMHYAKHTQLSSKGWSKYIYLADLTRAIYILHPRNINYSLHTWEVTSDHAQHRKLTPAKLHRLICYSFYD